MLPFIMLSHVSRKDTSRAASLAQLSALGIQPLVIESDPPPGTPADAEVRRRGYDALLLARDVGSDAGMVFLEDDILVDAGLFLTHLEMAVRAGVTTAFCAVNARHYPPGLLARERLPIDLVPIPNYAADRGFHGSQAVYLPPALVAYGVSHPEQFMSRDGTVLRAPVILPDHARGKATGFDFWLKHTAQAFGGMLVAIPNSVDHDDRGSVHAGGRKLWRSPTFGRPVESEVAA